MKALNSKLFKILNLILAVTIFLGALASCGKKEAQSPKNLEFYNKLYNHKDVNILITGDSIGFGAGTQTKGKEWFTLLESYLEETYGNNVNIKNVSLSAGTSYTTYYNTELTNYYEFNNLKNEEPTNYDLVLICSGHNDDEKDFSKYYETIIRSCFKKYPKAAIVAILQSSQRTYTPKIKEIQKLCEYYNIPTIDMIKPFESKHKALTIDYVHPNDEGQKVYFENISKGLTTFGEENIQCPVFKDSLNKGALDYTNFKFFSPTDFKRTDALTYEAAITEKGALGIDYCVKNQDSKAKVYLDGKLIYAPVANIVSEDYKRNVVLIKENCDIKKNVKIVFESKEQADLFAGIAVSSKQ